MRNRMVSSSGRSIDDKFRVVVVTKDEATILALKRGFVDLSSSLEFLYFDSAVHMQLELQTIHPQILMLDRDALEMIGGFEWFRALRNHRLFKHITIVLFCEKGQNSADLQGQALSYQVKILEMPFDMTWLNGYLSAALDELQ